MPGTPWYRLVIFLTCLLKAAEIQAQCVRPTVGENIVMVDDSGNQTFPINTTVTFKCATGYRPVDPTASKTITCVGPEWTQLQLNCTKKSCGSLTEFPNGKYTYPDGILFGATAVAQCNEGYLLIGEKTRNCRDNGWDGRDPECQVVKCKPPATIENGDFEPVEDSYDYSQVVTYTCSSGYTLDGPSSIVCSANEAFDPSPPRCILVECEKPNITNAVRVGGKSPPYGYRDFVVYECKEGYTMNGSGHLVCEIKGWDPSPPVCIAQCERPAVGVNMVMINDSGQQTFSSGSIVTFNCATGYIPVDSSASKTMTCVGPEWTQLQLNCTKKSCGSLTEFPNGKYTYPDGILFGATAVAECNKGYLLVGEKTRNCRDNGWDGRHPECQVVKCKPPATIENGDFEPVEDSYDYSQAVSYTCSDGYTLDGPSSIACSANETFDPSPPSCILVECEKPNITNAVRVEGKSPPYGYRDFVRYECKEGYTMNGSAYLVCEIKGWDPSPPECIVNQIPTTTSAPSDSTRMKPSVMIVAVAVSIVVLLGQRTLIMTDAKLF